jgi:Dolichyl-phosphate-mannose-protein mannosyltransferase
LAARSNRIGLVAWLLLAGLIAIRIPSVVQPAGGDQALYAYVGQRILAGAVPYRDAWDQKPPAVHLTYAALIALWPHESVVAGADLIVASLTALSLVALGRRLTSYPGAGMTAAVLFLLLGNPAFGRLGGVRVRAQCEVFIALAIAAALLAVWNATKTPRRRRGWLLGAGLLVGLAALFKYNAVVYGVPVAALLVLRRADGVTWGDIVWDASVLIAGAAVPSVLMLAWMAGAGALQDLYLATVDYNLRYSGETYTSRMAMVQYLVTFPIRQARLDSLWFLGGLGSAVLIAAVISRQMQQEQRVRSLLLVPPLWVGAACLAIAINGSRGLPQYFLQAGAPLALAAGVAAAWCWTRVRSLWRVVAACLLIVAVLRISNFEKVVEATTFDLAHMRGETSRRQYLMRFGRANSGDKYAAEAVADLASYLRGHTAPGDRVLVFGFSPWALVGSGRVSASRFFWSRPVIIGFAADQPGYGVDGLLGELNRREPRLVVLQERDWDPDGPNSADFFLANARLAGWLRDRYEPAGRLHNFQLWRRRP